MSKIRFNYKNPVSPFVDAGYVFDTRYYFGNGHFLFKKSSIKILDKYIKEIKHTIDRGAPVDEKGVRRVIPKDLIDDEFIPIRFIKERNKNKYVTDGNDVFNAKYYWLITKFLGLRIFPHGDYNDHLSYDRSDLMPFAIVDDGGNIVGCIMPCVRRLLQ